MRRRSASRNQVAAVLVGVGLALAITSVPSPAHAEDEATKEARQHYRKAKQFFDLGQWDDAIAEYREAYRLRSDPAFLFNIAQAYRRKGDLQRALDLYKNFLIENPTTSGRGDIEKRIQTLEEEMKKRSAVPPAPATAREPSPAAPAVVAPEPSPKPMPEVPPPAPPKAVPPAPPPASPAAVAPGIPGHAAPPFLPGPVTDPTTGRPVYFAPVINGGIHVAGAGPGKVSVDGQDKGNLPLDMPDLYPGTYRVRVELQDGTIDQRDVDVGAGRMTRIFVDSSPDTVAWLARKGAHVVGEAGVGFWVGKKGSWIGAQGGAGGYLNVGIVTVVDFRAGLRFQYGSLGSLNSVTLLDIPVQFRFNLGTTYSIALGVTMGNRWTNGNTDPVPSSESGLFFGPELSLLTFRFGKEREFEVAAVQGMIFPVTSSRGDYILAWSGSALDIFYNSFTFSMLW